MALPDSPRPFTGGADKLSDQAWGKLRIQKDDEKTLKAIIINGVTGDEKARFLQNSSKLGSIISSRMDDVSNEVVTGDPVPAAPTGKSVVSPSVQDLQTKKGRKR